MSYMAKKTQKRQTTIISLSDSNQQELENIRQQREQMLKEYQDKKQGIVFGGGGVLDPCLGKGLPLRVGNPDPV